MDTEREIQALKERNKRVEADKAWETSLTRRISICAITYIVAAAWLRIIGESGIWLKATVPVLGYVLSTISIPQIRKVWQSKRDLRKEANSDRV